MTDNIIEQNIDVETFVIQSSSKRPRAFKEPYEPLQFVHFSDVHRKLERWDRIVEYINHYQEYISFALHTGDYCGSGQLQYVDFYADGKPCVRPIYNCIGNHDVHLDMQHTKREQWEPKSAAHGLLFNHTDGWDVSFLDIPYSMTYFKDFPESNVRLAVLDLYFDIDEQATWLADVLEDARGKGLHVITAMHEPTDELVEIPDTTFHTLNNYGLVNVFDRKKKFEDVIVDFKNKGGIHVCNLCGHHHHDLFGHTALGVLNCAVECATTFAGWCDGKRVEGTRTADCFNVTCVDANLGLLKLVRVGDNTDMFLQHKTALCYDYLNKKVLSNC